VTTGSVTCDRWRDAISARADGEELGVSTRLLDAHLSGCAACRAFAASIEPVTTVPTTAAPSPDLSRHVARLAAIADRAGSWTIVRGLLAVVAVEILVFSLPELVLGENQDASEHSARHLGAFTVAYAVGLLVVVVRPARARTMLPVAAVLAGALLATAVADMANGRVPLVDEAQHLPEVVSVVLVWLIAVPSPRRRGRAERRDRARPELRVVEPGRRVG
jgi:predicted anti-sigma-YlaC factor YlaD